MYKMIAIDLDGTLLDDNKQISKENIEMLNKVYEEKSVLPIIVTGKKLMSAKEIADNIGECCQKFIIASNGTVVKDFNNNNYINKKALSPEQLISIIRICKKANMPDILIQTENEYIIEEINPNVELYKKAEKTSLRIVTDFKQHILTSEKSYYPLMTVSGKIEELKKARKEMEKIHGMQFTEICKFSIALEDELYESNYIDIMYEEETKTKAINILANHLGIKQEEIIVIGDGGNDTPMFEESRYKVAMGNAEEYLKEKADYITTTNNESGVAEAIKHIFYE